MAALYETMIRTITILSVLMFCLKVSAEDICASKKEASFAYGASYMSFRKEIDLNVSFIKNLIAISKKLEKTNNDFSYHTKDELVKRLSDLEVVLVTSEEYNVVKEEDLKSIKKMLSDLEKINMKDYKLIYQDTIKSLKEIVEN